jgi:hypothetical protein
VNKVLFSELATAEACEEPDAAQPKLAGVADVPGEGPGSTVPERQGPIQDETRAPDQDGEEPGPVWLDVAALWAAIEAVAPRSEVAGAVAVVEELLPDDDGSPDAAMRTALTDKYVRCARS